jgi:hypothetical protein
LQTLQNLSATEKKGPATNRKFARCLMMMNEHQSLSGCRGIASKQSRIFPPCEMQAFEVVQGLFQNPASCD